MEVSRRGFLKTVGLGAAAGMGSYGTIHPLLASASDGTCFDTDDPTQKNSLFDGLDPCCPNEALADDEMRITFLGTSCTPMLAQQAVSVYVEVGPTDEYGFPADYAIFDCGMGCLANYIAAGIAYRRMDKIFVTHLHADHMSELSAIYCFGESSDR